MHAKCLVVFPNLQNLTHSYFSSMMTHHKSMEVLFECPLLPISHCRQQIVVFLLAHRAHVC